uniref:Glutamine cyclotransferase n=1 Tax=Chromera velia CCMP2878 TaxID=1169474 RepID=A0A0G4HHB4_9ALVE|eukprot:Cvel_27435.t1-p1 / transcript=Cvel_27435.t1 / gene=Cvel_27435 / organism=Chromera_velia_CCMP2878 / gene_product=Glutaminyl-peptide cyclotransferase, putative / transcript_product=Glutaminyl-peptide cyclotransferase, putative / location=Cvel_scaffold3422:12428-14563(+) / protein_length=420 / sequence_SO=supercontig / SO=protein_coding / is_pseudo=false
MAGSMLLTLLVALFSQLLVFCFGKNATEVPWNREALKVFEHESTCFTQGLEWVNSSVLLESCGDYNASHLVLYEAGGAEAEGGGGKVLKSVDLPGQYFGESSAIVRDRLFVLTWREEVVLVFEFPSLEYVGYFLFPNSEGWGLAYDAEKDLLYSTNGSPKLMHLQVPTEDPLPGWPDVSKVKNENQTVSGGRGVMKVLKTFTVRCFDNKPTKSLNDLALFRTPGGTKMLAANVWFETFIVFISPLDGQCRGWMDFSGVYVDPEGEEDNVLNGLAWSSERGGERLFLTGKMWPHSYEAEVKFDVLDGGGEIEDSTSMNGGEGSSLVDSDGEEEEGTRAEAPKEVFEASDDSAVLSVFVGGGDDEDGMEVQGGEERPDIGAQSSKSNRGEQRRERVGLQRGFALSRKEEAEPLQAEEKLVFS